MVCLYCGHATQVINSRRQARSNHVWRRRQCLTCKRVYTTVEMADLGLALHFKTRTGHVEPFSRDKLLISIYDSLRHRPNTVQEAAALTHTVLAKLRPSFGDAVVDRVTLVEVVHNALKRFDRAAAVHYQAYHPPE